MACRNTGLHTRKDTQFECVVCQQKYVVPAAKLRADAGEKRKLCSKACVGEFNRRRIIGTKDESKWEKYACETCGEHSERLKAGKNGKIRQYCSKRCKGYAFIDRLRPLLHSKMYDVVLANGSILRVRSRWEAVFIKDFLEKKDLKWSYEPKTFVLSDGSQYTPDFYIEDDGVFIEIKGADIRKTGRTKANLLRDTGQPVVYADKDVLIGIYGLNLIPAYLKTLTQVVTSKSAV